jgi:hypothetical protein
MPPPAPGTTPHSTGMTPRSGTHTTPIRAMLVGAPKAGTTSLYRYAAQHPDINSHSQRELSYFFSDDEYDRGYNECVAKYYPDAPFDQTAPLAKHVFTMYSPVAINRLKDHNPDARVIALLRDPVRRAYSSYWYARRRGWDTAKTFEQAIKWEADQPADDWLPHRDRMHLRVGVYHPHIKRLLDTFGKNRVHVFLTDDLAADAPKLCRAIFDAAGIDPGFTPDLTTVHNPASAARSEPAARALAGVLKSKNPIKRAVRRLIPHGLARRTRHVLLGLNEKPFTPPPMNEETRGRLIDHFAPHNKQLAELIGRDLSAWSRA